MSGDMYITDLCTMRETMEEAIPDHMLTPAMRERREKKSYGENLLEALNKTTKGIL